VEGGRGNFTGGAIPVIVGIMRRSDYPTPVIGIAGGIGAGKSIVARGLQDLGCLVIDSDAVAHEVIQRPQVKRDLVAWWGSGILRENGTVDRREVARHVFGRPDEVQRLNNLLHPLVAAERDRVMAEAAGNAQIAGVVWDTPLLFEVGWDRLCDAVIFVKVPYKQRLHRVHESRGWDRAELDKRENLQMPLDKKENLADYVLDNSGEVITSLRQLRDFFSQIQAKKQSSANRPPEGFSP